MIGFPNKNRSTDLGTYPLETLPRDPALIEVESERSALEFPAARTESNNTLARAAKRYQDIFIPIRHAEVITTVAPVPEDLKRRSRDIKGGVHFLDTSQVGICKIPANAWYQGKEIEGHQYAVVVLVEFGQFPEADNSALGWLEGVEARVTSTRAAEIAAILAGYIGQLGFSASAHWQDTSDVDLNRLGVLAGLVYRDGSEPMNPFLGRRYVLAAVTTEYSLEVDQPLKQNMGNTIM